MKLHILILAGGSGTRLWPASRDDLPKQFLSLLTGEYTLLQQTALRTRRFVMSGGLLRVVAARQWERLIDAQLAPLGFGGCLIEEPAGRNTAPAIALGLAGLLQSGAAVDDAVLICPSDHLIQDEEAFGAAVETALEAAAAGMLVTFGVPPDKPETGYGYIKTGAAHGAWRLVERFVEKPALETARRYLEEGGYLWNAGLFCFRMDCGIEAYRAFVPESAALFDAASAEREAVEAAFARLPATAIDYAVMERARNIACVELRARWSDIGCWDAVYENAPHDAGGNALSGETALLNCAGTLIQGSKRLIAGLNLQDMLIIDTEDALFIAPRGSSQELRELVRGLPEHRRKKPTKL